MTGAGADAVETRLVSAMPSVEAAATGADSVGFGPAAGVVFVSVTTTAAEDAGALVLFSAGVVASSARTAMTVSPAVKMQAHTILRTFITVIPPVVSRSTFVFPTFSRYRQQQSDNPRRSAHSGGLPDGCSGFSLNSTR